MTAADQARYEARCRAAIARNRKRDDAARAAGYAPPGECDDRQLAVTVAAAIQAGLVRQDWRCVAEGYVMLLERWKPPTFQALENS